MKSFLSIDDQIQRLQQRNVIISNTEIAKQYLTLNNYYNVINSCARDFLRKDTISDEYLDGTTFDEIIAIHKFENELKHDILEYLLLIEKHLKSTIAHAFCSKHSDLYACLSKDSYNFNQSNMLNIAKTIEILAKNITEQINQKIPNPIKHYAKDHQDVPMYVLISELTFGNIVYLFKIMQHAERAEIINIFNSIMCENLNDSSSKIFPNDFDKMLDNLLNLRNTTAHNSSLFTFKCRGNISYIKSLHERFNIAADAPKQDLYNIIITFACFLPKNDFRKLYNSILKRCKRLNQKLHTISPNQIYIKLGFPIGFYGYPKIAQN